MDEVFFPISKFEHINSNLDEITRIKELSLESKKSFLFNEETLNFLKVNLEESDYYVLDVLNKYVSKRINLVDSKNNNNNLIINDINNPVIFGSNIIKEKEYSILLRRIDLINEFLIKITSKITLEVKGYQEKIMEDGELGISFELYSNNKSKGFINLINVISAFIEMQNNENGLIVIDDIDTSINEYLLKGLIKFISNDLKGQILFTSNNLDVLEELNPSSIYFATINPNSRYNKINNVKGKDNLLNLYLKSLGLETRK